MKSAVVVGAASHVGFALCQKLISMEVDVTGYELKEKMNEEAEDMLMEIGRNSFFKFEEDTVEKKCYDTVFFLLDGKETSDRTYVENYLAVVQKASKVLIISSYKNKMKLEELRTDIESVLSERTSPALCSIFLPMVYGPWQSEEEIVHMRLVEELEKKTKETIWIDAEDVLYVEDAASAIFHISAAPFEYERVLLINEKNSSLAVLMKELNLSPAKRIEQDNGKYPFSIKEYKVKQTVSIREGLQAQKKQINHKLRLS
jgi:nucleoside-diphosphate-sugar epimerase